MTCEITLRDYDIFVEARFADLVSHIFAYYGYDAAEDDDGNIVEIDLYDSREDEELYLSLIPFLREGSYMEFCDDRGNLWRWVFSGGDCHKIKPTTLWPGPVAPPTLMQEVLAELDQYLLAA
jgi:hypothetical protein